MTLIRRIEVNNFRSIKSFDWFPSAGVNCLLGPGDAGKSTILDAIDLCLGARRSFSATDADFYMLDVSEPIRIRLTLGQLDPALMGFDAYGVFLRGLNLDANTLDDEPGAELETVLTLQLTIESDLEPQWTLWSKRAEEQGNTRNIRWADRVSLAPTRLGVTAESNLSWRRGSILNRVSDDKIEAASALARAARDARESFGDELNDQLSDVLTLVDDTADKLGIAACSDTQALLDAYAISFSGGAISLHDAIGVPLKNLGLGSMRLLIAGLQRAAQQNASVILVDEVEHGLEPHRIIRLLDALGAKDDVPIQQVFMTTHSPVAVRELDGSKLTILRSSENTLVAKLVGETDAIQGTVRLFPEALLAPSVLVCEGASEMGYVRGLDQYRIAQGEKALTACGVALVNGGGREMHRRALAFQELGYRVALFRDSDVEPPEELEASFLTNGGTVFAWDEGNAIEDALFECLDDATVEQLLDHAIERRSESVINDQIVSASDGALTLAQIQLDGLIEYSEDARQALAKASKSNANNWFKNLGIMQEVAEQIIGPGLDDAGGEVVETTDALFDWIADAGT